MAAFTIYGEASIAMICLLGLMFDDSAVIKRSKLTCAPTPPSVKTWLQLAESSKGRKNITGDDGRVYCVRCHVWRPRDSRRTTVLLVSGALWTLTIIVGCLGGALREVVSGKYEVVRYRDRGGYAGAGTATASLLLVL